MLWAGWIIIGIIIIGFVVCYGYVIGVSVKDLLPRLRDRLRRFKDTASTDESTYGRDTDPTHGQGSDSYGRHG